MKDIQQAYEKLGDRLHVLAIDLGESKGEVLSFYQELGLTYPAVLDKREDIADRYGLFGLPSTFLLDDAGVVASVKIGPFAGQEDLGQFLDKVGL